MPFKVEEEIESLHAELDESDDGAADSEAEICPVCFTEPLSSDRHRLEVCGHLYCKSCLQTQIGLTAEVPLTCVKEVETGVRRIHVWCKWIELSCPMYLKTDCWELYPLFL